MGRKQQQVGSDFETEFTEYLRNKGYFVYRTPINRGQPCDLIACKNNIVSFFECKTSCKDSFPLSRLECNQHTASDYIASCGNTNYFIAIKFRSGITIFNINEIKGVDRLCFRQ
jgi:Holliday junction resolvase